jgi:hypothetical protein
MRTGYGETAPKPVTARLGALRPAIADSRDRKTLGVKGQCHAWKTQVPAPGRDGLRVAEQRTSASAFTFAGDISI